MKKSGWQGSSNPMVSPMEESVDNAVNISVYHLTRLEILSSVDPTVFGDLTKKYIVATNTNLTASSDVIFNIKK